MTRSRRPRRQHIAVAGLVLVAVTACSNNDAATPSGPRFRLSEFAITLNRSSLPSSKVAVTADNVGAEEHELVMVKAASVADLPTKTDGSVDEDRIPEADKIGEIDHVAARSHKTAEFTLAPGTYIVFCNIVDQMGSGMMGGGTMMSGMRGHVHFAAGMHEVVTAK